MKTSNVGARLIKFIYSEKATKFCEIFPLLLTVCTVVKSKRKISQNFVAFSEYMNFKGKRTINLIYAHVLIVKKIIENFTAKASSKCKS